MFLNFINLVIYFLKLILSLFQPVQYLIYIIQISISRKGMHRNFEYVGVDQVSTNDQSRNRYSNILNNSYQFQIIIYNKQNPFYYLLGSGNFGHQLQGRFTSERVQNQILNYFQNTSSMYPLPPLSFHGSANFKNLPPIQPSYHGLAHTQNTPKLSTEQPINYLQIIQRLSKIQNSVAELPKIWNAIDDIRIQQIKLEGRIKSIQSKLSQEQSSSNKHSIQVNNSEVQQENKSKKIKNKKVIQEPKYSKSLYFITENQNINFNEQDFEKFFNTFYELWSPDLVQIYKQLMQKLLLTKMGTQKMFLLVTFFINLMTDNVIQQKWLLKSVTIKQIGTMLFCQFQQINQMQLDSNGITELKNKQIKQQIRDYYNQYRQKRVNQKHNWEYLIKYFVQHKLGFTQILQKPYELLQLKTVIIRALRIPSYSLKMMGNTNQIIFAILNTTFEYLIQTNLKSVIFEQAKKRNMNISLNKINRIKILIKKNQKNQEQDEQQKK